MTDTADRDDSEFLTEAFEYLDELRLSEAANMYAAAPYVAGEFGIDNKDARDVLSAWMKTFSDDPASTRAAAYILKAQAEA